MLERLSAPAFDVIESGRLRLPGIAELELQYLHEIGRLRPDAATVVSTLARDIGLARSDAPLAPIVAEA